MKGFAKAGCHQPARLRTTAIALVASGVGGLVGGVAPASASVLRVGSFRGLAGQFSTIQAAVDAAHAGDFVLIGPGDYHETGNRAPPGAMGDDRAGAAVLATTPGLHIRGMDRDGVMLDGTRPGAPRCSAAAGDQNPGPADASGRPSGRNGLVVFKAGGTSVENLSACNFVTGSGGGGDELWMDGGGASGHQGLGPFRGAYLSATSTFYAQHAPFVNYGIYSSNTTGPGVLTQVYANNSADAAFYIGACPNCNTILDHAHGESSDLGYSGTNSGGDLLVQHSEFNNNQAGFVTNSQNNDDYPSPQDGRCPRGATGPKPTGTQLSSSCWVFVDNSVHDNNNPNVPSGGAAAFGPVGTGVVIAGGRDDIVTHNAIFNNNAWGVLLAPYPDTELPPAEANPACVGGAPPDQPNPPAGQGNGAGQDPCYFDDLGNEIAGNTFSTNGAYGNLTNGDAAEISNPNSPGNCWHDNTDTAGPLTSDPAAIQSTHGQCGVPNSGNPLVSLLALEAICDSQILGGLLPALGGLDPTACPLPPGTANYPRVTAVQMPLMPPQTTMPDPCAYVPRNPWCPRNSLHPPPYPVPGPPYTPGIFGGPAGDSAMGACPARRLSLALRHRRGEPITSVVVWVDRRVVKRQRGRSIRRVVIARPGQPTAVVQIVTRTSGRARVTTTRAYRNCKTGRTRTRTRRSHRHR